MRLIPLQSLAMFQWVHQSVTFLNHWWMRSLRKGDWHASLQHVFRETNKYVDFLAKSGFNFHFQLIQFDSMNHLLQAFIQNDCSGVSTARFVS